MERFSTIVVSKPEAEALENNTRQQSSNNIWHHVRSIRLTSSSFKRIFSRRADFEQLATIMQRKKKNIMTKAMKRGLELEPAAAAQYAVITGNEVQVCGFVINPNAPYLGTSPDRRVKSVRVHNSHMNCSLPVSMTMDNSSDVVSCTDEPETVEMPL
ncbi:unnamed protein product [Leuciscus chuanchicus]